VISFQHNEGQFILSRTADGDRKMRDRLIIGLCIVALGWPNPALAQQSASHALETLPLWAQLALLIGPAASAIFAAIGLLLNFYQSRRTNAQVRAALVAECLKSFAADENIQLAYYAVARPKRQYAEAEGFQGSEERDIDKLLRHFSNIALAWRAGLLSIHDIRPIQYYMLRVVRNPEIKKYLESVARGSKEQQLGEHPYTVLNALTEQLDSR
jgi:hypothetical protein